MSALAQQLDTEAFVLRNRGWGAEGAADLVAAAAAYDVAADAWEEAGDRMRAWDRRWYAALCRSPR